MEKIYIVDAVNYLFRSYYAIGPMTNPQGQSTSALFGFIRSIQKLIKDFAPSHLVCVFDGPDNKKSRQSVYAEYKMHRKGAPEDLFPQFELAYKYCQMAGIATLSVDGVEADDTMATIALWAKAQGATAFLCSSDKDLMQLVDDKIFLLQLHKNNLVIDSHKVEEIYGVKPTQMLDFLAIMGDASDNIPGLEGFGPKTASSLLQQFGTLDAILAHPEKVKGAKKQEVLKTQQQKALMSRELATLDTNVKVPKEASFYEIDPPNIEKLTSFFQEMGFQTLLKNLSSLEEESKTLPKKQEKEPCKAALHLDKREYHLIDTEEEIQELVEKLLKESQICVDTETTDLDFLLAHLVGVGLGIRPGEAWYIPLNGKLGKKRVTEHLAPLFDAKSVSFFGHNLKYDFHILTHANLAIRNICFDTLLASYLLDPQKRKHNLDDLSLEKFNRVKIPIDSIIGKGKKQISMRDVPIEKVFEYCAEDVDYTTRLSILFHEELKKRGLEHLLYEIELPLLPILAQMEEEGIFLNTSKLQKVGARLAKELKEIKERIFEMAGAEFNLNSPKQLSHILYEKLAIPSKKSSTGADVLESLIDAHPIIAPILQYRTLEKLRSTYVDALPNAVSPITGRIHCTFNQSITATGRLSSQNPNLQNIPRDSEIRSCFEAKEGSVFVGADYSQIELRLLAHFSKDPELLDAFQNGRDIHTHTASLIFDVEQSDVTSSMRQAAKTVNFGIIYGQGAFGLAKQLGIPFKKASDFIKKYFERYPKVVDYLEECKEKVRVHGYSKTLTGRQRPIPEIHNKNPMIRSAAERLAVNTPLQGTAADLIKMAMISIDKALQEKGYKSKLLLQIHDELIFETPENEILELKKLVKHHMEHVFQLDVPIEVDIAVGKNWAEC